MIGSSIIAYIVYENSESVYHTEYFSLDLAHNWTIEKKNNLEYELFKNAKNVGRFNINPDCDYNSNLSSIISNWIGMHAYVEDTVEYNFDSFKCYRAYIAFEQSAAQRYNNVPAEPEELHYFYTKDNSFIDLFINAGFIDDIEVNEVAMRLIMK